ncbi:Meiosis inhibitor protein 1 [Lamellibrachia satsuma]|nr:Meiosis inhibitor protein 1 [Lamellibrachia satsuma]
MDTAAVKLELFTESHREHYDRWMVHASDVDVTCFACLMELLEDQNVLLVKKKFVLAELLRFLSYHTEYMLDVLSEDFRVIVHATVILLDLMEEADEIFASMAVEGVLKLVMSVKVDDLMCGLLDSASEKCLKACDYKKSLPLFNLVGKLLQRSPPLAGHLLHIYGSFVDFLCAGLTYPDANVHISLSYIFICLYAPHSRSLISAQLSQQVATHVLGVLNNNILEHDSMMNILGLMKVMLEDDSLVSVYTCQEGLCSALKKVLLGRDQMLQIAAVQCLVAVIAKCPTHMEMFLDKDMAEFLFEALSTCNELLISSLFCCLILFADANAFFSRCHAVYGMEAILRALDQTMRQKNPDCIQYGLQLLAIILERHTGGVRLFSCASMVRQCLALINGGIQHHNFQLSDHATTALIYILR